MMDVERTATLSYWELYKLDRDKEAAESRVKALLNTLKRTEARNEELWRCLREMRKQRNQWTVNTEAIRSGFVAVEAEIYATVKNEHEYRKRQRQMLK